MKKFFIALCAFALLLPTALGLVACDSNPGGGGSTATSTQKARNVYAYSAIMGASYFSEATSLLTSTTSAELSTARPSEVTDAMVNELKSGLKVFDKLIESGVIDVDVDNHGDAGYSAYQFKMEVSIPDQTDKFIMYFSEYHASGDHTDVALNDPDDEVEFSTTLKGVIVYGDKEYPVRGERTYEEDNGETESEIEFRVFYNQDEADSANPANYVELSQETETSTGEHETEYKCKAVVGGYEIFEFEVEFENENGKLELEIEFEEGGTSYEYKFKKGTTAKTFVATYQKDDGAKIVINIAKTDSGYTFTYSNGYSEIVN